MFFRWTVFGCLALALLAGSSRASLARQAQAPAAVVATLFGNTVSWTMTPSTFLTVELLDGSGIRAAGGAASNEAGEVTVSLAAVNQDAPGSANLQPGDQINLNPLVGTGTSVIVPTLRLDGDADLDRVAGRAPAGAALALDVRPADFQSIVTRTVGADGTGAFSLNLSGQVDLETTGSGAVHYVDGQGNQWSALMNVLEADMTLGSNMLTGRASPGLAITVTATAAAPGGAGRGNAGTAIFGDGAFTLPDPARPAATLTALLAGDRVTMTLTGSPLGSPRTLAWTVPALTVLLNQATNSVSGTGPAGAQVVIELTSPADEVTYRTVTVGPGGIFQLSLAGIVTLGSGWQAVAYYRPPSATGVRVKARGITPAVQIGVDTSLVRGTATPLSALTITLSSATMVPKAQAYATAEEDGSFQVSLADSSGNAVYIQPGDRVEVAGAGSPISATVPNLTALTDSQTDIVSGQAVAGSAVTVTFDTGTEQVTQPAAVDGAGRYSADLTSQLDVEPPMNGLVEVDTPGVVDYFIGWAAVRLRIDLTASSVGGNGSPERLVQLTLRSGTSGTPVVATALGRVEKPFSDAEPGTWEIELRDETGALVPMRSGDVLEARVGDDLISLALPPLTASGNPADDRVTGNSVPNSTVALQLQHPLGDTSDAVSAVTDSSGSFTRNFSGVADLRPNDVVIATVVVNHHAVLGEFPVAGLLLRLDLARISGHAKPNTDLVAELRNAGGLRAAATAHSGPDGAFQAFWSIGGTPLTPATNDQVTVKPATGATPADTLQMTVPELTMSPDSNANVVQGRATPGGKLSIAAFDTFPHTDSIAFTTVEPVIAGNGNYAQSMGHDYHIQPGTELSALYIATTGNITGLNQYVPIVSAAHGGPQVCGLGAPGDPAATQLLAGAAGALGSAASPVSADGTFNLALKNRAGALVATDAGQLVRTLLGSAMTIDIQLPALSVQLDWNAGTLAGTGPPNAAYTVISPVSNCLSSAAWQATRVEAVGTTSAVLGAFAATFRPLEPGQGLELALFTAQGQRFFKQFYRTHLEIYVDTPRIAGRANPMANVTLTLRSSAGTVRGLAAATADGEGNFSVPIKDGNNLPVNIAATDRLSWEAADGNGIVTVLPIHIDSLPGADILAGAPAGRDVRLELTLADGRHITLARTAGADNTVRFAAANLPPRASWAIGDVVGVRLVLPTADGHAIVAERMKALPTPTPTPTPGGPTAVPSATNTPGGIATVTPVPSATRTPGGPSPSATATPSPRPSATRTPPEGTPTPPGGTPGTPGTPGATSEATRTPRATATGDGKWRIYLARVVKKK